MKTKTTKTTALLIVLLSLNSFGQNITFSFLNAQITSEGDDNYYEADVLLESNTPFKLGIGLLYFNYNTEAFGENVNASGALSISAPENYVLAEEITAFATPIYGGFLPVDNTASRFAFSWNQLFSSSQIADNNIINTPKGLFHIKIKYSDTTKPANVVFEAADLFDGQTYTACGGPFATDCYDSPGTQLVNDSYDSTGSTSLSTIQNSPFAEVALLRNPVNTHFEILGLETESTLKIYSLVGQLVKEVTNYKAGEVAVTDLKSNIYLIEITQGTQKKMLQLLKQ